MRKNKKGFTLVELVIVIAVIAILAAVLLPTFSGIITRARLSSVTQRAEAVRKEILGQYFDTVTEMNGVTITVRNDSTDYTYTVDANGKMTGPVKSGETGFVAFVETAVAVNDVYVRNYGNDVYVTIPAAAHFGTNAGTTGLVAPANA